MNLAIAWVIFVLASGLVIECIIIIENYMRTGQFNSDKNPTISRALWRMVSVYPIIGIIIGALLWHFFGVN